MVLNLHSFKCTIGLHGPELHDTVIVTLSAWLNTGVGRSEALKKVVCLACWIYTGTLWQKELLSEFLV